ncbi:hypothetical protein K6119_16265 [Paracrocinitomix mangrovi]|uniref:toxin-antitoxin system YwqK family antitoxin n=1 Tax=Paracrocinitomix mangrovi TaxID=2862509 RepID=UPI001C8EC743|nr:hypothetical protein [Paracrocinitomix mangrovi]UKN01284.1 hypothetical protein K6119_16265 [Paracrocinitomix mangrovi]
MTKWSFLLILPVVIWSCKGEEPNNDSENQTSDIDSTHCDCHELTFDEPYNHFYRFERRVGYTGNCQEYYADGSVKLDKNFVDGKVHGKMISYHENGQIHEDQEFDMNFQVGERIIYTKSGKVKFHALYKRGQQTDVLEAHPELTLDD